MIKDESYLNIQGWMITRLGLSGVDLLIYAIIWGFSQDEESEFKGSCSYLKEWCGCSLRTIMRSLSSLAERGLIVQTLHSSDNYEVHYIAVPYDKMSQGLVSKCHKPYDKMSQGLVSKCHKPCDKMSQANNNNLENKLEDKLEDKLERGARAQTKFIKPTFEELNQYITENGYSTVDPNVFLAHYDSNGWKVGKNPMKDWKAAVRSWAARDKKSSEFMDHDYSPEEMEKMKRSTLGDLKKILNDKKKRPAEVKYLENEYTPEHLKKREEESLQLLDDLLKED